MLIQSMLGLVPLAPIEALVIDPVLPPWAREIVLEHLRVGGATVSLRFWREEGDREKWEVIEKRGTLHVVRQPPPEAPAGAFDRLRGALESLF